MEKSGFEFLPHTADVRMRAWGRDLKELFSAALRGVAYYLKPEVLDLKKRPNERVEVKVEAVDLNSLLVEFLSEAVAQSDIQNTVYVEANFGKFGDGFLEGSLRGIKVDGFDKDIKAVSYHEVDIRKNPETGMYETTLVFDI